MTSDKIEDGVAKLLVKGDVVKVAGKSKSAEALEAEELLKECLEIAEALGGYMVLVKSPGKIFGRIGLKLTNKEKSGRERTSYTVV